MEAEPHSFDLAVFRPADAAAASIDALVSAGRLGEDAIDDHDVRERHDTGAELVPTSPARSAACRRTRSDDLGGIGPCVVRERCRLRRLSVR